MNKFLLGFLVILSGCAHLTRGSRPLHEPNEAGYQSHLSAHRLNSEVLSRFCERYGNPDGIEIGLSGSYYVWKSPRMLLRERGSSYALYLRFSSAYDYLVGPDTKEYKVTHVSPSQFLDNPDEVLARARQGNSPIREQLAMQTVQQPVNSAHALYNVEDFHRIAESEFGYAFRIRSLTPRVDMRTIRLIKEELRREIAGDYCATYPNAKSNSIQVDFPEFDVQSDVIDGRAEVMCFAILLLDYNQTSHRGVIRVKIGASRFEDARKWVRSNIETLSRDKNIALTTGAIPPAAQFILGAERVREGGILEVEFETL